MLPNGATDLIHRAYRLNQHPALKSRDRVGSLWYGKTLLDIELAVGEMELAIEASGLPLDDDATHERKVRIYRTERINAELAALDYKPLGVNIAHLRRELQDELQQINS